MRLSEQEKQAFIAALTPFISGGAELKVFGSRVDDSAKGGDIDLLLIVTDGEARSKVAYHKADILSQIKSQIGDQKIDLLITTEEKIVESTFLKTIIPGSQSIMTWSE